MDSYVLRHGLTPSSAARRRRTTSRRWPWPTASMPTAISIRSRRCWSTPARSWRCSTLATARLPAEYEQMKGRLPPGQLAARMGHAGYKPEDVDVVVITHGHPDHIGGLTEDGQPVFPNARYVFGAAEFDFWKQRRERARGAQVQPRAVHEDRACRSPTARPSSSRATRWCRASARSTPSGHSPGMLAFMIESDGKRMLNWADTAGPLRDGDAAARSGISTSTTTRRRRWPPASASSTWWRTDGLLVAGFHMSVSRPRLCRAQRRRIPLGAAQLSDEPMSSAVAPPRAHRDRQQRAVRDRFGERGIAPRLERGFGELLHGAQ